MHFGLSCTAALELLQCGISIYIHFNDEAFPRAES
jgi:hypothetical protein